MTVTVKVYMEASYRVIVNLEYDSASGIRITNAI